MEPASPEQLTLKNLLDQNTHEGTLYEKHSRDEVTCYSCGHRCLIKPGRQGICKVRFNHNGTLMVPWGYVAGLQVDPIEKKPFFHVLPGSTALSFGMLGCDYHCGYCQNWVTSQALRDPTAISPPNFVTPAELIQYARRSGSPILTSTYNEPLITSEWAVEIFKQAKKEGLRCSYVSNGNGTPEVLKYIRPYVDYYKVDLKSFQDKQYRQLGGVMQHVLDTIRLLWEMKFWIEIVTLIVPGFNDSKEELTDIARFLRSISADIPWHVTAFHQDYKMQDPDNTSTSILLRAAEIGYNEGLHFVYAGNIPGRVKNYENTYCWNCQTILIERVGYQILQNKIKGDGKCYKCGTIMAGAWV